MDINRSNTRHQRSWPWWRILLTGLNMLALVLSAIMSWHYLRGGAIAGCGGGSPCELVLNSRWSMIAGIIPVSGLAVGVYLALMAASFFIGPSTEVSIRRLAWKVMLILAGSITGSAIWFTILQKWIIGDFCPYCMTTHITGLLLASLVIWRAITESGDHSDHGLQSNHTMVRKVPPATSDRIFHTLPAPGMALIGLILAGILAGYQIRFTSTAVYRGGESKDILPGIDYHVVPMAGSPDAPSIVTLLFDYQCSHCQKIHFMLDEAIRRYSGRLAFALCPAPLNTRCNPYIPRDVEAFKNSCELTRVALAVWVARREVFPAFENWMFTFESGDSWRPRSLESARVKAVELVGQTKFDAAWSDPWIDEYMQTCIQIYGKTIQSGNGRVPKLIFGSKWVVPGSYNSDDLVLVLQKSLDVPRP